MRPASAFIVGTDTGVGKTVVTALLIRKYQLAGLTVVPFKPIATGAVGGNGSSVWADTAFLADVAQVDESLVGQFRFAKPLSPHLAAAAEGRRIELPAVAERLKTLTRTHDAVLVEGVGGLMVPLSDGDRLIDLVALTGLPVVIVTRPHLGTLNHTLLTVDALRARGIDIAGLIFNRCPAKPSEAERANPGELERLSGIPVLGQVSEIAQLSVDDLRPGQLLRHLDDIDLSRWPNRRADHGRALAADRDHVWHPFTAMGEYLGESPHPLMIVKADGCYLEDSDGRRYLDGVSSLWVNVHGHRQPRIDEAVRRQLAKVAHTTLLGLANEPAALLAQGLVGIAPRGLSRVFYSDNGSTAVEAGLKVAFQYWAQKGRPEKREFVSFVNAYHGDTLGAVSVGGIDLFHAKFGPLLFETHLVAAAYCYRCPVGLTYPACDHACLDELVKLLAARRDRIAAVVFEPKVQGAAGILVQPPGYLRKVADVCRRHDVLLIADEVATGFGRTGRLFACEHEQVTPDIMAMAKGITGGYLPLAATLFTEEIYDAFLGSYEELKTFFHGHTYTGNPLACAAALANLELISGTGLVERAQDKAEDLRRLLGPLADHPRVGDVRQCGLMAGIELVADKKSGEPFPVSERVGRRVILKARDRGVIIRPLGDVVVLMPPPAIAAPDLDKLVDATAWAIGEVLRDQS